MGLRVSTSRPGQFGRHEDTDPRQACVMQGDEEGRSGDSWQLREPLVASGGDTVGRKDADSVVTRESV